jgi:hypothetical protein
MVDNNNNKKTLWNAVYFWDLSFIVFQLQLTVSNWNGRKQNHGDG